MENNKLITDFTAIALGSNKPVPVKDVFLSREVEIEYKQIGFPPFEERIIKADYMDIYAIFKDSVKNEDVKVRMRITDFRGGTIDIKTLSDKEWEMVTNS